MVAVSNRYVDGLIRPMQQQTQEVLSILREQAATPRQAFVSREELGAVLLQLGANLSAGASASQPANGASSTSGPQSAPTPQSMPTPAPETATSAEATAQATSRHLRPNPSMSGTGTGSPAQADHEKELCTLLQESPTVCTQVIKSMRKIEEVWCTVD